MCHRVFLGSDFPLPLVELAAAGDEFQVRAVTDDRGVRERLGVASLVEAVTEQGCACDFDVPDNEVMVATIPGDADADASLARAVSRARRLHGYVVDALARGPVAAYVCWWDEEREPPAGARDVQAEWFLRPALDEVDRHAMRVRS